MHLHLGIEAKGLPPNLACHYIVVNDWEKGVTAPQNVVLVSIPSLLDPSLAPSGKHVITSIHREMSHMICGREWIVGVRSMRDKSKRVQK
jgi:phytoene dehydrogenase-like protein